MEEKIYDLDKIAISLQTARIWENLVARKVAEWYKITGRAKNINSAEIPDEQFRVFENGNGEIFVDMPDGVRISLSVPKGHWTWIEALNN